MFTFKRWGKSPPLWTISFDSAFGCCYLFSRDYAQTPRQFICFGSEMFVSGDLFTEHGDSGEMPEGWHLHALGWQTPKEQAHSQSMVGRRLIILRDTLQGKRKTKKKCSLAEVISSLECVLSPWCRVSKLFHSLPAVWVDKRLMWFRNSAVIQKVCFQSGGYQALSEDWVLVY